jgi:hypothetical protein
MAAWRPRRPRPLRAAARSTRSTGRRCTPTSTTPSPSSPPCSSTTRWARARGAASGRERSADCAKCRAALALAPWSVGRRRQC